VTECQCPPSCSFVRLFVSSRGALSRGLHGEHTARWRQGGWRQLFSGTAFPRDASRWQAPTAARGTARVGPSLRGPRGAEVWRTSKRALACVAYIQFGWLAPPCSLVRVLSRCRPRPVPAGRRFGKPQGAWRASRAVFAAASYRSGLRVYVRTVRCRPEDTDIRESRSREPRGLPLPEHYALPLPDLEEIKRAASSPPLRAKKRMPSPRCPRRKQQAPRAPR
jgi:hypothetical protein